MTGHSTRRWGFAFASALLLATLAHAFNPPEDSTGPLKARIEGPVKITQAGQPVNVKVVLENSGETELRGDVRIKGIEDWKVDPSQPVPFTVSKGVTALDFTATPGPRTLRALYPIHAFVRFELEGKPQELHPVLIAESEVDAPPHAQRPVEWKPLSLGENARAPLCSFPVYRAVLVPAAEGAALVMPAGWQGTEPESRGSFQLASPVERGGARTALSIHPPWQGNRFVSELAEFPVALPVQKPVTLGFGNAIRDHFAHLGEPASDGVTFRVRVVPFDAADGALGEVLFEKHTDAKTWQDAEVDLSAFAGKSVRVQLESHPGPDRNTACDQSFWGAPVITCGNPASALPASGAPFVLGKLQNPDASYDVVVVPGSRGLLNATVSFEGAPGGLSFRGFPVRVAGDDLSDASSLARLVAVEVDKPESAHYHVRHRFENFAGSFDVVGEAWLGRESLQVRFHLENGPEPQPWHIVYLEDAAAGAWNRSAKRVYAGVGNVMEDPKAFQLAADGHRLATSFVGFEFDGVSIVQGVDLPPDALVVDPEKKHYSLHAPHQPTFTFIPAPNVWQGVRVWREVCGLEAAPGVSKLAGRFAFDLWGGRYGESADALARAFRYGLTDSVVVWHNWQRWGYDYRLPDIFPPNPQFGTHEEFLRLADTCNNAGVLFAPHDNYTDFYPDAEGFTYDDITFWSDGQPSKGWLNEGRGAQSYRWRPDRFRPYMQRNARLIKDAFAPTAYFIDVLSSASPYDYWTRDGQFNSRVYTRNEWAATFDWVRALLGQDAPQISESGLDQLIGHLDGAQTNHLRVRRPGEPDGGWMVWPVDCGDAERVPWIDAAHHDRFALHGAGYESRYAGGLDTRAHGIFSDDYMSTEVLTGHPAMVPEPFSRNVVRKYWLLHDLMRTLALQRIDTVDFVDNIHRQRVGWEGGQTYVNRGSDDWNVDGNVLPQYGFHAHVSTDTPVVEVAVERRDGRIVEWARSPHALYANARPSESVGLAVRAPEIPLMQSEGRNYILKLQWETTRPPQKDMRVFVHFIDQQNQIAFQADYTPPQPVPSWQGVMDHTVPFVLPEKVAAGEEYELRVGLYDESGYRARLDGLTADGRAVRLGRVRFEGSGSKITGATWTAVDTDPLLQRLDQGTAAVDFGFMKTDGACRVTQEGDAVCVMPLPDSRAFQASLNWDALPWKRPVPQQIVAVDEAGKELSQEPASVQEGIVAFTCEEGVFAYRIK